MNKIQRNKNKTKKKSRRSISKPSNNPNSMNELLNDGKIKEQRINNNINNISEKISYPPHLGEIISKIIIDKIITLSVRNSENNENCPKYQDYYFDYLETQINNLFSINNIFYTEEPENIDFFDYRKFWKTSYNKANTWVEIKEPNSSKCDRFEGVLVKYIPLENDTSNISNDLIKQGSKHDSPLRENNNIRNDINDPKNKNKKNFKNYKKSELESLEEIGSDSGDEEQIQSKEKKSITMNSSINKTIKEKPKKIDVNLKQSVSLDKNLSRKKKFEKVEFSSEDIPGINELFNFDKYDPPEIEVLRKDYEKEMKEKNVQLNKILNQKIHSNINKGNFVKEIKFDSEKLTFDPDGRIIKFKPLNINILANDFKQLKHKFEIQKPLKKMPSTKKIFNRVIKRKSSIKATKNEIKIIKNPADDPELNRGLFIKINPEKKTKVIQSGNNFNLMFPNIGVVMKEEDKIKKGNRDFGKFFKKYSLEDYDKILKEYLPKQNQELVKNHLKRMQSSSELGNNKGNLMSLSMNNSKNFYNNSFDFPNPLINQDNLENETNLSNINSPISQRNSFKNINANTFNNFKNATMNNSSILNNNFNNSSMTNRSNKFHIFNQNRNGFIKLKNVSNSSLKIELDLLNDLDLKNQFLSPDNKRKKFENIFSKRYQNIFKKETKENEVSKDLNDLNKKIIRDVGWGNDTSKKNSSSQNIIKPKQYNKSQIFRELGNNFLNNFKLKLPRDRKTSVLI